jgi:hypothetical protein
MFEIFWLVNLHYISSEARPSEKMICKSPKEVFEMLSEHHKEVADKWIKMSFQDKLSSQYMEDCTVEPVGFYEKGEKK